MDGFWKGLGLRTTCLVSSCRVTIWIIMPRLISLTVSTESNRDKFPSGRSSIPAAHRLPPSCEPPAARNVWHSPKSSPAMNPGKEKKKKKKTAGYDAHPLARWWQPEILSLCRRCQSSPPSSANARAYLAGVESDFLWDWSPPPLLLPCALRPVLQRKMCSGGDFRSLAEGPGVSC